MAKGGDPHAVIPFGTSDPIARFGRDRARARRRCRRQLSCGEYRIELPVPALPPSPPSPAKSCRFMQPRAVPSAVHILRS